jgi:hypothetical protein
MRDTIFLIILQYNVRNDRVTTMISLLTDSNTQDYDIIAIQKLWRNLFASTSLSLHQCEFHLLYRLERDTRVCFYINDKIDAENWEMKYSSTNICVLTLTVRVGDVPKTIRIHNVYNSSSISYSFRDSSSTLSNARRSLIDLFANHHVLLENSNLHHSFWSESTQLTQHAAVDELLDLINEYELSLILSIEIVTWETRNICSIIDLTFMTSFLTNRLEHCIFRSNMRQSLDHVSIFIRILLDIDSNSTSTSRRRAWKLLDMKKLKETEKKVFSIRSLEDVAEIDDYVREIQKFLRTIIDAFVSWAHFNRYAKSFSNSNCDEITKETRRLRRIWSTTHNSHDWTRYMKSNDRKQKIIQKVKRLNFRHEIEKVIDSSTSLWRLVRWIKNKSHALREVLKMSVLKFNDQTADTFDEKVEMFKNFFFLVLSSTDLRNIEDSFHSQAVECSVIITTSEMSKVISRTSFDKTSSSNEIINRLIKICSDTLTRLLIFLFQICVTHAYHSIILKQSISSFWESRTRSITSSRRLIDQLRCWTSSKRSWNS